MPPRRGLPAQMLYANANRERVLRENPKAVFGEIGAIMMEEYNQLSPEIRATYEAQAEADRKRYEGELAAAEATPHTTTTITTRLTTPHPVETTLNGPSYLVSLPRELQSRITEFLQPNDDSHYWRNSIHYPNHPSFRALQSLSHTSHLFRNLSLPLLWHTLQIHSIGTLAHLRDFPQPRDICRQSMYPGSQPSGLCFTHWVRNISWEWNWRDIESEFWGCDERQGIGLGTPLEYAFVDREKWYLERMRALEDERRSRGGHEDAGWIMEDEPLCSRSGPDGRGPVRGMNSIADVEKALEDVLLPTVGRLRSIAWGPSILPLPEWLADAVAEGQREGPVLESLDLCFENLHWEPFNNAVPLLPSLTNLMVGDDGSCDRDPEGIAPCSGDVGVDGYPSWLIEDGKSIFRVRFLEDGNVVQREGVRGDPTEARRLKHNAWTCKMLLDLAEMKSKDPRHSNNTVLINLVCLDLDVLLARPLLPLLLSGIQTLHPTKDPLNIPIETHIFTKALSNFRTTLLAECKPLDNLTGLGVDSQRIETVLSSLITAEYSRLLSTPNEEYFPVSYWAQTPDSEPTPACAMPITKDRSPWTKGASFAFPFAKIRGVRDRIGGLRNVMELEEVVLCVKQTEAMFASWLWVDERLRGRVGECLAVV